VAAELAAVDTSGDNAGDRGHDDTATNVAQVDVHALLRRKQGKEDGTTTRQGNQSSRQE